MIFIQSTTTRKQTLGKTRKERGLKEKAPIKSKCKRCTKALVIPQNKHCL